VYHRDRGSVIPRYLRNPNARGRGIAIPMSDAAQRSSPSQLAFLYADDVWKSYDNGSIKVLNGVYFCADAGRTVALCGPSGCGKSTLLNLLGGLDKPDRGSVSLNGAPLRLGHNSLRLLRHEVGFVFRLHNLIPDLTLQENCLLPAVAAGTNARARLMQLTEHTGLAHRLDQPIQKLSGGERQRTALCRALMNRPRFLLADEPTGSLDEHTGDQVFNLLLELVLIEGITLVMATHDRALAERCDRLVEMRDGRVYEAENG
jgi:lipoprotein-releasing system ATP-binding protein